MGVCPYCKAQGVSVGGPCPKCGRTAVPDLELGAPPSRGQGGAPPSSGHIGSGDTAYQGGRDLGGGFDDFDDEPMGSLDLDIPAKPVPPPEPPPPPSSQPGMPVARVSGQMGAVRPSQPGMPAAPAARPSQPGMPASAAHPSQPAMPAAAASGPASHGQGAPQVVDVQAAQEQSLDLAAVQSNVDPAAMIAKHPPPPVAVLGTPVYAIRVLMRQFELRRDLESLRRRRSPDVRLYEAALKVHDGRAYILGLTITGTCLFILTVLFFMPVILRIVHAPD